MITPQHEEWLTEMKKADFRLRSFPNVNGQSNRNRPQDAAMRWALSLARNNLDDLSDGDLRNLQGELTCFSVFEMKEPYYREYILEPAPLVGRAEIAITQQWLRTIVDTIRSHRPVQFTPSAREWFAVYSSDDRRWTWGWTEDVAVGAGVTTLFHLILQHLEDLQECALPDCGKLFLRDRTNQRFCSKRCQWRDGQRRAQNVSPDRYGKRGRPAAIVKSVRKGSRKTGGGRHGTKRR